MEGSRKHFRQTHHEFQKLGVGSFGETYLSIKKFANDPKSDNAGAIEHKGLVAVKYSNPSEAVIAMRDETTDLRTEIDVLKRLLHVDPQGIHPGVLRILDGHVDGRVQWMTSPFMSGGDLRSFVKAFPTAITTPFAWENGYRIFDILLWLYFGIRRSPQETTVAKPAPGWPHIAHADLHMGNILVGPASSDEESKVSNFPRFVLADFGQAIMHPHTLRNTPRNILQQQAFEVHDFGSLELGLLVETAEVTHGTTDLELKDWQLKFWNLLNDDDGGLTRDTLLKLMLDFHSIAETERRDGAVPMPQDAVDAIAAVPLLRSAHASDEHVGITGT